MYPPVRFKFRKTLVRALFSFAFPPGGSCPFPFGAAFSFAFFLGPSRWGRFHVPSLADPPP